MPELLVEVAIELLKSSVEAGNGKAVVDRALLLQLGDALAKRASIPQHAFVEVAGGVAYVTDCPPHVKVHVINHDDLDADFEFSYSRLAFEAQSYCLARFANSRAGDGSKR